MLNQIIWGCILVSCTLAIQTAFISLGIAGLEKLGPTLSSGRRHLKLLAALNGVTLCLLAGLALSVLLWATALRAAGAFDSFEPAIYFCSVAFTTVGFGDLVLPPEHRLVSGFIAASGLISFSLATAFLIEVMRQLHGGKTSGD